LMVVGPESMGNKKWLRIALIVGAIVVILATIVIFFWQKNKKEEAPTPTPTPTPVATTSPATTTPSLEAPNSLITVESTIPEEITEIDQVQKFIAQIFNKDNLTANKFARLLINDASEYLGLKKILPQLYLSPPPELYTQIRDQATFYIYRRDYNNEKYNAFGFAAELATSTDLLSDNQISELINSLINSGEITEEDLASLEDYDLTPQKIQETMTSWENNLVTQTKYLGQLFEKNVAQTATFQSENYSGYELRYMTLVAHPDCFGACYCITENKLHFATCCKPIVEIIKAGDQ